MYTLFSSLVFLLATGGLVFFGFRRGGFAEYPFLFCAVYLGWLCPQLWALQSEAEYSMVYDRVPIVALLILLAVIIGWNLKQTERAIIDGPDGTDGSRLLVGVTALTVAGVSTQLLIHEMSPEIVGQWTGPITIIAMLSNSSYVAMAFSYLIYLKERHWYYLLLTGISLLSVAPNVLFAAKRGPIGTILAIFILGAWFTRRWQPPRILIFSAVLVGALVVNSVGEIRELDEGAFTTTGTRNIFSINYWDNIERLPAYELRNAAMYMWVIDENFNFNFGASIWNAFVNEYVPGQFVGFDTKRSLRIGSEGELIARDQYGYVGGTGATSTGLTDSFQMFWYLGFIIFFAISAFLKKLFRRASLGKLSSQVIYCTCISSALQSLTHYSTHVITLLPLIATMVWLVQRFGAVPGVPRPRRRPSPV